MQKPNDKPTADIDGEELDRQAIYLENAHTEAKFICKSITAWEYIARRAHDTIQEIQEATGDSGGKLNYLTHTLASLSDDMAQTGKELAKSVRRRFQEEPDVNENLGAVAKKIRRKFAVNRLTKVSSPIPITE